MATPAAPTTAATSSSSSSSALSAALRTSEFTDSLFAAEASAAKTAGQLSTNVKEITLHDAAVSRTHRQLLDDYAQLESARDQARSALAAAKLDLDNDAAAKHAFYGLASRRSNERLRALGVEEANVTTLTQEIEEITLQASCLSENFFELQEEHAGLALAASGLDARGLARAEELTAMRDKQHTLVAMSECTETEIVSARSKIEELQTELDASRHEQDLSETSARQLQERCKVLEKAIAIDTDTIAQAQGAVAEEMSALQARHEMQLAQRMQCEHDLKEAEAALAQSLTDADKATKQCQSHESDLARLTEVAAEKDMKLADLKKEISTHRATCEQKGVVWKDVHEGEKNQGHSAGAGEAEPTSSSSSSSTAAAAAAAAPAAEVSLVDESSTCKIIRKMLKARNLDTNGKKAIILKRINAAIIEEASKKSGVLASTDDANMTGASMPVTNTIAANSLAWGDGVNSSHDNNIRPLVVSASFTSVSMSSVTNRRAHEACASNMVAINQAISKGQSVMQSLNEEMASLHDPARMASELTEQDATRAKIKALTKIQGRSPILADILAMKSVLPDFACACEHLIQETTVLEKRAAELKTKRKAEKLAREVRAKIQSCKESMVQAQAKFDQDIENLNVRRSALVSEYEEVYANLKALTTKRNALLKQLRED